jgi:hypothetical protein
MAFCACPLEGQASHHANDTNQPASRPVATQPPMTTLSGAEARFTAILAKHPGDGSALSGMGFVRLQQRNYLGAISYFEQAKQTQPKDTNLTAALDAARFWFFMDEGDHSLTSNELTAAERRYLSALELRPDSHQAFAGLHTTLLKARKAQRVTPAVPPAHAPVQKASAPAFAAQTPAGALHPIVQPAKDTERMGRSVPPPTLVQNLPAQQAVVQPPATATQPAVPLAKDGALTASVAATPPPVQKAPALTVRAPIVPTGATSPRPTGQPASVAPSKEEVYGPFVPYVRPVPPQLKMAAIPSIGR